LDVGICIHRIVSHGLLYIQILLYISRMRPILRLSAGTISQWQAVLILMTGHWSLNGWFLNLGDFAELSRASIWRCGPRFW